ncbi:hypothetical protein J1N35_037165 [Gossypium stocksii]|uniref:Uncharacterized protein n=1 Tax=Gossypium stocksii TaxID=47602 RepID=A0A9D3ZKM7_9ROSI|nr:hypothetical protein J1N35_037165 [Gossypium stocksii]
MAELKQVPMSVFGLKEALLDKGEMAVVTRRSVHLDKRRVEGNSSVKVAEKGIYRGKASMSGIALTFPLQR